MRVDRILLGVDGSASNLLAARWTQALAVKTGASVVAVHAISGPEWPEVS